MRVVLEEAYEYTEEDRLLRIRLHRVVAGDQHHPHGGRTDIERDRTESVLEQHSRGRRNRRDPGHPRHLQWDRLCGQEGTAYQDVGIVRRRTAESPEDSDHPHLERDMRHIRLCLLHRLRIHRIYEDARSGDIRPGDAGMDPGAGGSHRVRTGGHPVCAEHRHEHQGKPSLHRYGKNGHGGKQWYLVYWRLWWYCCCSGSR